MKKLFLLACISLFSSFTFAQDDAYLFVYFLGKTENSEAIRMAVSRNGFEIGSASGRERV